MQLLQSCVYKNFSKAKKRLRKALKPLLKKNHRKSQIAKLAQLLQCSFATGVYNNNLPWIVLVVKS